MTRHAFRLALACALALPVAAAAGPLVTKYEYHLATSTGVVPFSGARLAYDRANKEMYVLGGGPVRVFNESGMEIFTFGDSPEVGTILGVGVLEGGDLVTLSLLEKGPELLRLNFRGEYLRPIARSGVPKEHEGFEPNAMKLANGKIYLANLGQMTFMVLDADGKFVAFFDTFPLLMEADEQEKKRDTKRTPPKRDDLGVKAFDVDKDGNIIFVVQPLFKANVLSLDGKLRSWGVPGSAPGKFNVISSITSDDQGNYYVTDILKSAVIAFDPNFQFIREFGYRGRAPHNLVSPVDVAAGGDLLFVSQFAKRGVSVFKLDFSTGEDESPRSRRRSAASGS